MARDTQSDEDSHTLTLFLCGDVMTGRGVDQVLPHPCDPRIYESYVKSAGDYVKIAEHANGPIPAPVPFDYIWGNALAELGVRKPAARIVNLETAVTSDGLPEMKGINYRMHPENVGAFMVAGIDCCVLANNHVLDWGRDGLLETLRTLEAAGIAHVGAGRDAAEAEAPAVAAHVDGRRVMVFALGSPTAGVPLHWAAGPSKPGVNLLPDLTRETAERIADSIRAHARSEDLVVVSIHWGSNWGYEVSGEQRDFARWLIEASPASIIHGHSSHHPRAIEVHRGKLILYGCGDFINDYEGIAGCEYFRDDLVLMYFPALRVTGGTLAKLEIVPLKIRNMRLEEASRADSEWLVRTLTREGRPLGTRIEKAPDGALYLAW